MHNLKGSLGVQAVINSTEYDSGEGINAESDYYYLLGSTSSNIGRKVGGYIDKFNWVNINANLTYTYNHLVGVGVTLASDYASSFGNDAPSMAVFPSVNAAFYAKNAVRSMSVSIFRCGTTVSMPLSIIITGKPTT